MLPSEKRPQSGALNASRWQVGADGWLPAAHSCISPNYDERPLNVYPKILVVHAISLPPDHFGGRDIDALFTNTLNPAAHPYYESIAHLKVSAHFLIRRDGELMQYVSTAHRAWHAGVSCWNGIEKCNDFSIGVELEGCDTIAFEKLQYPILVQLTRALWRHYPLEEIVGHEHIAPGRKTDPGPYFDWDYYRKLLALD
ncbi:MAG: 1,6-anhydro-N-acetylmuramyl-L-alanine amidase AmpD [Pseudomonadota bacterium]